MGSTNSLLTQEASGLFLGAMRPEEFPSNRSRYPTVSGLEERFGERFESFRARLSAN